MKLFFDNIIFGLQKYGGITNYWKKIIENPYIEQNEKVCNSYNYIENKVLRKLNEYKSVNINDADLFHSSYYRIPNNSKARTIVTCHDLTYEMFSNFPSRELHVYQKKRALLRANDIICISKSSKNDLLNFYNFSKKKNIHVVYHGVDKNVFFDRNLERNTNQILYVGSRAKYKRFDVAVKLIKKLKNKILVFTGGDLSSLELDYLNENIPGRWKHLGIISNLDLSILYNSSLCLLFPSEKEGFGLPILEASSCGCPVIINSEQCLVEVSLGYAFVAKDNEISAYESHMKNIENNLSSISKQVIKLSDFYSWDKTLKETFDIYNNI